jgi:hypothetical protein
VAGVLGGSLAVLHDRWMDRWLRAKLAADSRRGVVEFPAVD